MLIQVQREICHLLVVEIYSCERSFYTTTYVETTHGGKYAMVTASAWQPQPQQQPP